MKAIILSAGIGSRMGELTKDNPKCLLEINGKSIIRNQVEVLKKNGINDISVVVGYKKEKIIEATKDFNLKFYLNPRYSETGVLESLYCAREELESPFILLMGDVYIEEEVIKNLLQDNNDFCIVVDNFKKIQYGIEESYESYHGERIEKGSTKVLIERGIIKKISKELGPEETSGETVGILKFSKTGSNEFIGRIKNLIESGEISKFPSPSFLLRRLIEEGNTINSILSKRECAEIDHPEDLEEAKEYLKPKKEAIISCHELANAFKENDLTFFSGVPDSTFKDWMKFLGDGNGLINRVACNECEAVAHATGYHLSTGKTGVVYMQNSGLGKIVNPLTSLASKEVYAIPMVLMIGWRGEPEKPDEPQHKMMGRIMESQLKTLEIPYEILPGNIEEAREVISRAKETAEQNNYASAIIIKKKTFEEYNPRNIFRTAYEMSRENAIKTVIDNLQGNEVVISTTGKTSRELFELRINRGETPKDFLTVGSMGCSASIAAEIALQKPDKKVYCFDGDGAVLMQMGALSTIGNYKPKNFTHIIFDNSSYDSTGGQPTNSSNVDFGEVARACGYNNVKTVEKKQDLVNSIKGMKYFEGPNMIVVKVNKGARKDLGRPTSTPQENKEMFMRSFGTIKPVVLLDGDDVILDTGAKKIQWLKENFQEDRRFLENLKPYQCSKPELVPMIGEKVYDQMGFYVYSREGTLQISPKEGALNGIFNLSKIADLYLVSQRREDHTENLREWCRQYNISNCFKGIYSVQDPLYANVNPIAGSKKVGIAKYHNACLFVDDDVRHMPNEQVEVNCLLFGGSENEVLSNIKKVNGWDELVEYSSNLLK
ncbi:MAG: phosphonopyruvate decarboxylase [archaeon]